MQLPGEIIPEAVIPFKRNCDYCDAPFQGLITKRYCTATCRNAAARQRKREHKTYDCVVCGSALQGKARMYCSGRCKSEAHGHSYENQQSRGLSRKLALVAEKGGACCSCGYSNNLAALVFHHRDESTKLFSLDVRSLSNHSDKAIRVEVDKCDLLCSNCHHEHHHPQMTMLGGQLHPATHPRPEPRCDAPAAPAC